MKIKCILKSMVSYYASKPLETNIILINETVNYPWDRAMLFRLDSPPFINGVIKILYKVQDGLHQLVAHPFL